MTFTHAHSFTFLGSISTSHGFIKRANPKRASLALDPVRVDLRMARAVRTADGLTVYTLHAHFLGIALGFARYLEPTKQPPCDEK